MSQISELSFLFFSAFLAATVFPTQSEVVLAGMVILGKHKPFLLLFIATLGNVLGSLINWLIGVYFAKIQNKGWFKINKPLLSKAIKVYEKWGVWSLLFSWVPIIGDPLTIIAGIFKTNIWLFLMLVTVGKMARYSAIIYIL